MDVQIWGDFACPFCYMGETTLEQVVEKSGDQDKVKVRFRAYELDPEAPAVPVQTMAEHFASSHELSAEEAAKQMAHIERLASHVGIKMNLEGMQVCSTFDAHRLMKLAVETADADCVKKLNFSLFKANFVDNRRLSDHAVLTELAVAAGLDPKAVADVLASDRYAEAVRADEKEAEGLDLEYIPYMRFDNGRVLQGVLTPGAVRKALEPEAE